ncbi:MAG: OmpA family protein [Cecembia sp.]
MSNSKNFIVLVWMIFVVFSNQVSAQEGPVLDWSNFDFVSGDEIIFEDNLEGERNGEFPSKWDLANGTVENAVLDGENVIMFINTNANSTGGIVPLISNNSEDYLPDDFTIEFDAYFDEPGRSYRLLFFDGKNQVRLNRTVNPRTSHLDDRIQISQNSATYGNSTSYYPGFDQRSSTDNSASAPGWRRVSVSFNQRALKVYLDEARVLNIPNMSFTPIGLTFSFHNPRGGFQGYMKDIRIAKGAVPLYDKMVTDGKIVTTGIRFDVNKATLRPESYGILNEIVKLMNENPDLNFSVEGHTDNTGSEGLNQTLSEARAKAVMEEMINMGIAASRLSSVGHGQSTPVASNDSPEGRAENRRVEFVKF